MDITLKRQPLLLLGLLLLWATILQASRNDTESGDITSEHGRSKRTLVYTFNSCSGVLIALSIPLLITGRNIFMSYNFEANYNMPTDSTDFTQGILKKGDNEQIHAAEARKTRDTSRMLASTPKRSSMSRKKFYRTIELNLQRYGFAGKRCILRMICDLAETPLHHENGVLGDVLQLIFTPSLSQDENLPNEFTRAEQLGREQGNCNKYRAHCPASPIDLSKFVIVACLAIACSVKVLCAGVVDRSKRTLVYTSDSATGILIALSVPLLIPDRNIFLAYNFEANYGMPGKASDFTQGVLKKVDNDQIHPAPEGAAESERTVRSTVTSFTRKQVYRMIELNLTRYGYNGKKCILRMICEMARHPVDVANGIVGDLLQLVFTPTGSNNEELPNEFYVAEDKGHRANCAKYEKYCPKSPLDSISLMF
uniref:Uncharacterized protein n=1 Tax=Anopheles minimus TaxID=112268 RepID=A0A182VXL8_9DIPT